MSFGALSEEAKTALAKGAEMAGDGHLQRRRRHAAGRNRRKIHATFMNWASGRFGYSIDKVKKCQAFSF